MKKRLWIKTASILCVTLSLAACSADKEENRTVIKEPGKTITIIENDNKNVFESDISVEKIDKYEGMEISDWLDEETVIVSKENNTLEKMSLLELSEYYPRSLYLYNLNTKEYKLIKERKNDFIGGAKFSPDKKHLTYYLYSFFGDPAHFVMNMDSLKEFGLHGEVIGGAHTANWSDNETVMGASFGGAYLANVSGKISIIDDLKGESVFNIEKMQDKIYYITINTDSLELHMLNLATKEKKNLNKENVEAVIPSPDRDQMLMIQSAGSQRALILSDTEGNTIKTIAEGTDISGASWSPDQRMIAYNLKSVVNGTTSSGLYIYDMLTGKSTQIAVNLSNAAISWSPSGKKIAFTELIEMNYSSSIIYLK